jgi:hypothetical protein
LKRYTGDFVNVGSLSVGVVAAYASKRFVTRHGTGRSANEIAFIRGTVDLYGRVDVCIISEFTTRGLGALESNQSGTRDQNAVRVADNVGEGIFIRIDDETGVSANHALNKAFVVASSIFVVTSFGHVGIISSEDPVVRVATFGILTSDWVISGLDELLGINVTGDFIKLGWVFSGFVALQSAFVKIGTSGAKSDTVGLNISADIIIVGKVTTGDIVGLAVNSGGRGVLLKRTSIYIARDSIGERLDLLAESSNVAHNSTHLSIGVANECGSSGSVGELRGISAVGISMGFADNVGVHQLPVEERQGLPSAVSTLNRAHPTHLRLINAVYVTFASGIARVVNSGSNGPPVANISASGISAHEVGVSVGERISEPS